MLNKKPNKPFLATNFTLFESVQWFKYWKQLICMLRCTMGI